MERMQYINTPEGQINLHWNRLKSWFSVEVDQEPKSKSIKREDAIYFQNKVLKAMKSKRKRAYKSSLVLQIDFYVRHKTPPSIHALAKNYLDLLKAPVPGLKTGHKKILYADDGQIKLLIVNYHLGRGPLIHIQAETLRSFICDLDLIRRIQTDDFEDSIKFDKYDLSRAHDTVAELIKKNNLDDSAYDALHEFRQFEKHKDCYIRKYGLKSYTTYRNFSLWSIQRDYLKNSRLDIIWLMTIFPSYYYQEQRRVTGLKIFDEISTIGRDFVFTLGISLPSKPTKKKESVKFKKEIKQVLDDFKKSHSLLFPLKSVLGLTVLFLPPKGEHTDLDNLARKYVVPYVTEIIQPPRCYAETIDINNMPNDSIKAQYLEQLKILPNNPRHSIVQYQIIEIPRLGSDPPDGYMRLLFNDGGHESNLLFTVKHILDTWRDSID